MQKYCGGKGSDVMIYYFPSCNFKKAHADVSEKICAYLTAKNVKILGCCRVSQDLLKEGDTILTNCTNCAIITNELSPNTQEKSVYEFILEDDDFPWKDFHGEEISVQDCWKAHKKAGAQNAVRKCLEKMNIKAVEIEENFEKTKFCGIWNLSEVTPLNMKTAPRLFKEIGEKYTTVLSEEEKLKKMRDQVARHKTDRTLVYCNTCESGLKLGEGKPVHLAELISARL